MSDGGVGSQTRSRTMRRSGRECELPGAPVEGYHRWRGGPRHFLILLMRTGLVETIEYRQDILDIFGIWVRIVKNIEERAVLGTQLFLQVIHLLKQR